MSTSARVSVKRHLRQARDKRAKFVELANNRVNRTLKDLALIGNLANSRNYEYDEEQAKKIIKALQSGVDQVKVRFASRGGDSHTPFEL
jgi:hypothetical protein